MKAIIEISKPGTLFSRAKAVARDLDAGKKVKPADYHLAFADAHQLLAELTPARLNLLDTLKHHGAMSIYALAKLLGRNYSNVHRDCNKLLEHHLLAKDKDDCVHVPWDSIVIRLSVGRPKAA